MDSFDMNNYLNGYNPSQDNTLGLFPDLDAQLPAVPAHQSNAIGFGNDLFLNLDAQFAPAHAYHDPMLQPTSYDATIDQSFAGYQKPTVPGFQLDDCFGPAHFSAPAPAQNMVPLQYPVSDDLFAFNDPVLHQQQAGLEQPQISEETFADEVASVSKYSESPEPPTASQHLPAAEHLPVSKHISAVPSPVFAEHYASGHKSLAAVKKQRSPVQEDSQRTLTKSPSPQQHLAAQGPVDQQDHVEHENPEQNNAEEPGGAAQARLPLYVGYRSLFRTAAQAKAHRKSTRRAGNTDNHLAHVMATKRDYWVQRIYEAITDRSNPRDGPNSTHLRRFCTDAVLDPVDLEACAHQVFDEACKVHVLGWHRPKIYHKEAVRGKHVDPSKDNVEMRLEGICYVLARNKAACNDALQGGLTLAKLVYNPAQRMGSKDGNNGNNFWKSLRLAGKAEKKGRKKKAGGGDDADDEQ